MSQPSASPTQKLWGGRFTGKTDPLFEAFNASISFDKLLWAADLRGSSAYAKALARVNVISNEECTAIVEGLAKIEAEWRADAFVIQGSDEDIHTANERRLGEIIGTGIAGKLHTGRSRNDQVATDIRLFLSDEISIVKQLLIDLISATIERANSEIDVLLPGYTHLQPAQPIRWSHFLLSHAFAWQRDADRLTDLLKRVSVSPLGSGALAGNPFGIDRVALASDLKFGAISGNSLDAVCDRDFIAEFLFFASLTMTHISQISEDFIIYSTKRFVTLADAYSTGSSLMPQKKNPDAIELLRGKSARVNGSLTTLMMLLKALPRAYNKDLQEDKEPLFDALNTLKSALPIMTGVISTMKIHPEAMKAGLSEEMLATDIAEYLVRKGVPFRQTHHIAGAAVKLSEDRSCKLSELTLNDFKQLHELFDEDILHVWDYQRSVESRDVAGGTSRRSQLEQIDRLKTWIANYQ